MLVRQHTHEGDEVTDRVIKIKAVTIVRPQKLVTHENPQQLYMVNKRALIRLLFIHAQCRYCEANLGLRPRCMFGFHHVEEELRQATD